MITEHGGGIMLDISPEMWICGDCGEVFRVEPVDLFVVGLPKQMNNEPSENMKYVEAFVTHLKRTIPSIPVTYYDERFTSVLAHKAMLEGGLKKKKRQDKGLVDEISAVIILQAYLESKKYQL